MSTTRQRPSVPVPSGKSNSPTKLGSGAGGGSTENPKLERKTKRKHKPPVEDTWSQTIFNMLPIIILLPVLYYVLQRQSSNQAYGYGSRQAGVEELDRINGDGRKVGHWDFGDGRSNSVGKVWVEGCENCHWVNTNLGNGGTAIWDDPVDTPNSSELMCPYNQTDERIHGFLGTHQPAIWMGESGQAVIAPGLGEVRTQFEERGLGIWRGSEYASPNYYRTVLEDEQRGLVLAEMSASSRVGHLRFTFRPDDKESAPHVIVQASRPSVIMSGDNVRTRATTNVSYPIGSVTIDHQRQEVYGWNDERQDRILLSEEIPAKDFKGYFVARFSSPFKAAGVSYAGKLIHVLHGQGQELSGWVTFEEGTEQVDVRVGVSFISIDQARRNLDLEIPEGQTLEITSNKTRAQWGDKLDRLQVTGGSPSNNTVLYTSYAHTLVYPYEISEPTPDGMAYYSGYLDKVVPGISYSGYSIWDTFRAQTAWLILTCPERVGGMIQSMLQDYKEGGWLPMWKNIVESNIMVGTHSDSVIAQAMIAGIEGFDYNLAWEAVRKNAFTPPDRDTELRYEDREEHTPQEARAGLTEYMRSGWVADDLHSESGSRTLDYAYDDYAARFVASWAKAYDEAEVLRDRSSNWKNLFNNETGFIQARNSDGSWAGEDAGWTEGDHWAYSLDVMQDPLGLVEIMGGNQSFIDFMNRHFEGGHNLHTNEPSHHIPYLYNFAGVPHKTQEWVLRIGQNEYDHTANGLSGNEDCGQMSAWYIFSAMGFYPIVPATLEYAIGTPFFDSITLDLPGSSRPLKITAKGAGGGKKKYIKNIQMDELDWGYIVMNHEMISEGRDIVFEMSDTPQTWGQ